MNSTWSLDGLPYTAAQNRRTGPGNGPAHFPRGGEVGSCSSFQGPSHLPTDKVWILSQTQGIRMLWALFFFFLLLFFGGRQYYSQSFSIPFGLHNYSFTDPAKAVPLTMTLPPRDMW